jgi:hypothetical protein
MTIRTVTVFICRSAGLFLYCIRITHAQECEVIETKEGVVEQVIILPVLGGVESKA